jgi:CBS-domain-containing membrane protein
VQPTRVIRAPKGWIAMGSTVKDVMTTQVVAVGMAASFKEMVVKMRKSQVSALPVIDGEGRVIGVVSEADMLNKQADLDTGPETLSSLLRFTEREKAAGVTAAELMTTPPVTIGPGAPVAEAARLMRDRRVKRLPVINDTGLLIGIISRADVLCVFARPDADIRREANEEVIAETFLADSPSAAVAVQDGIVTLIGRTDTGQLARALVMAIRQIDGVVAVRDELGYPGQAQ